MIMGKHREKEEGSRGKNKLQTSDFGLVRFFFCNFAFHNKFILI
jgi:hypothetical protein